ncbi:DUF1684 domain-containing protein [Spongiimicrobium sp. 2-473A-2-J]|uniref:DUF1684 domain-containing protein n=1 Tax=Eudoraea algarum TaxID=3417568 RepID=UPI003D36B8C3
MYNVYPILLAVIFFNLSLSGQDTIQSAEEFQKELEEDYRNPEKSPLKQRAKDFKGHAFFAIDSTYRVRANFVRTLNALPFQMQTTTSRTPTYEKYGEATFEIHGEVMVLNIYQSHNLRETAEYKDYLFLPFNDATNGEETYAGGRFLDLEIPEGDTILIDFNKAYNPYCAYAKEYSCPIPPKENTLAVKILAGVKKPKK